MIEVGELVETEETFYKNETIQIKVGEREFEGGKLYLASNNLSLKLDNHQNAFIIPWECISVTAITQDPHRCVYFMIDVALNLPRSQNDNGLEPSAPNDDAAMNGNDIENGADDQEDEGNASDDSKQDITEIWMLPDDPDAIDEIYNLMNKYPENPGEESGDDEEEFFDGNEQFSNMNIDDNDQFADALE